ncbi:MAG: tRNA uridine-5-carboxymethylaminomethyl(34) synthesis GTPase MnmE [Oscillospiraceae bacterium]|nr:tRNA uridine-5-carboxymethylaminomethyl(34) synthesis GTPase MnmE [Oscillospiraceae bacterium]
MNTFTDTIAALATPAGRGAVGIIRLSGNNAEAIAAKVCGGLRGTRNRVMTRVVLTDSEGAAYDDALACVMREPNSYTGQTVVEIYAHGSPSILAHTLETLYKSGARPAEPGEFTRRAMLNGKLDLLQAEAVCDLIEASTPISARNALGYLKGAVSHMINEVWDSLTAVIANVAAEVDYPEDDIPALTLAGIQAGLENAAATLQKLLDSYERGRFIKDGISVAIAGPPNAGKSSLFNALLGYDRAIVTEIAGTTRDSLSESVILDGHRVVLHDTAGLRDTADVIEAEGVRRAKEIIDNARLTLYVVDGSCGHRPPAYAPNTILIINKCDLPHIEYDGAVYVSALTGLGIDELVDRIKSAAVIPETGDVYISNARHAHAIRQSLDGVAAARDAIANGIPPDVALGELEFALNALAELTGKTVSEAVLNQIFEKFCVGK